ncbi:methyltransferase domain-containing protein [Curvibacter sp. RS43]|uniref:methyltransferase domain-containing protein n=1 Tax=Curvibacter microcysteis TaxID=3026419 RepID=UPI00235E04FA|nr:methyltransferase domain-containing protein [Curvibacter sp. RS43]MDD0811446.1 methyltransferase domain-containing protein [Curvibacter sp. RS43]
MSSRNAPLHVYTREIRQEARTSLRVLSDLVQPGARVLDLGCGSGALGHHLTAQRQCTVDGVTINEAEAELARPGYRRVDVTDLDQDDLALRFAGETYDFIICADVLEHLRGPDKVLRACRSLLAPGGQVLISIPNAGYAGLIAELMQGEFLYRDEGLLDRTHVRFFTRQSLARFLSEEGWGLRALDTIERELHESEFRTWFDTLAPTVTEQLLSQPDALTYQFIASVEPDREHVSELLHTAPPQAHPRFSANLYLGDARGLSEDRKLVLGGAVGQADQTLVFALPSERELNELRFDPADRPGFLHLHSLSLKAADGRLLWHWSSELDGLAQLGQWPHHDLLLHRTGLGNGSPLCLLVGNDPWVSPPVQALLPQAVGGTFEARLGWPLSADFMALAEQFRAQSLQYQAAQNAWDRQWTQAQQQQDALAQNHQTLSANLQQLHAAHQALNAERLPLQAALRRTEEERDALQAQCAALQAEHQQLQAQVQQLSLESAQHRRHVQALENTTVFRLTRPLVELKISLLGQRPHGVPGAPAALAAPATPPQRDPAPELRPDAPPAPPIDVIVPVYRGLSDTQRCIRSALASVQRRDWALIVINDCSPEPEVTAWLREVAASEPRITLLENTENLGFVATVNRGMSLHPERDVVLLNSDTEVANDWLDRLAHAAHHNGRVATVTPFSNNATICSTPRFCEANPLPVGYDTARLDALFARTNPGQVVDVPTGVGFCMYIRRDCLQAVGLFDVANFGKGYGEENDFCCRAQQAGWRNLHALDTFVLHAGGVSFGASKSARELAAMETLRRLHPSYDAEVQAFIGRDPARAARQAVDVARLVEAGLPGVLMVTHRYEGGTMRHVRELAASLQGQAFCLMLRPEDGAQVRLQLMGPQEGLELGFDLATEYPALLQALRHLGVRHVHYQHLLGHAGPVMGLAEDLGVTSDFTAHDFYTVCPQVTLTDKRSQYCGEQGLAQCQQCVAERPGPGGGRIEDWRYYHAQLLQRTRHVLAPSLDAAERMARYVPGCDLRWAPHLDLPAQLPEATLPRLLSAEAPLKVVVIGALSAIKGADLLEELALEAERRNVLIDIHLVGYGYRTLKTRPQSRLTVHGAYRDEDLPAMLTWLQPDVVWFPALWPETYSYTLSTCLQAGLPVVAPDLGAFPERLQGRAWSWLRPWNSPVNECLEWWREVREAHFVTGTAPTPPAKRDPGLMGSVVRDWHYGSEYLKDLPTVAAPQVLPQDFLERYRSSRF